MPDDEDELGWLFSDLRPPQPWFRQHRKRHILQRAIGDDDQSFGAKLGGDGGEHDLAQGLCCDG